MAILIVLLLFGSALLFPALTQRYLTDTCKSHVRVQLLSTIRAFPAASLINEVWVHAVIIGRINPVWDKRRQQSHYSRLLELLAMIIVYEVVGVLNTCHPRVRVNHKSSNSSKECC